MQARVDDRVIVHGDGEPQVGVVVEVGDAGHYRIRWEDGQESAVSPGPAAAVEPDDEAVALAEWEAAKAARRARTTAWRRGITAGVGREAHVAQEKLAAEVDEEPSPEAAAGG